MLKSLFPRINWDAVRIVGFDMDGTLYDEADFISQVYCDIAKLLAETGHAEPEILHTWMMPFEEIRHSGASASSL